jgi:hypothetical protein
MEIVENITDPGKQMLKAVPGAKPPSKGKWPAAVKALGKTWSQMHKSVVFGASPPINLEPLFWIICILHLNLRIVGALFTHLVVDDIGKCARAEDQRAAFMKLFAEFGIYMKERKLERSNNLDASWQGKFSFAGADAEKIMRCYPEMLDIIYPPDVRADQDVIRRKHTKSVTAFKQWELVWQLLNMDLAPGTRVARAAELQAACTLFVQYFVKAHKKTQGLYLHMLAAHMGDIYLQWGDLRPFQAQGLEHCHSKRKRAGVRLTNRKRGQRNSQHMDYIIGCDYIKKEFRHSLDAREHERNKKAKLVRALRRIKKVRLSRALYVDMAAPTTQ